MQVSAQLTKSEALVELATEFRAKRLGGGTEPYMAIHVRPYPDTCERAPRWVVWREVVRQASLAAAA